MSDAVPVHREDEVEPDRYPARWETEVVLSDGGTIAIRPIRPDDAERILTFHERQSPESIYFRFFSPRPRLSERDVARFTQVDYVDRMAFVGLNLLQSGFTGFCPPEKLLAKMGFKRGDGVSCRS